MSILQGFDWSIIQNAGWLAILQAVVFLILIVAIAITYRRVSQFSARGAANIPGGEGLDRQLSKGGLIREWKLVTQSAKT